MDLNYHGTDSVTGRRVLSVNIEKPTDFLPPLELDSKRFVCLLAWDAADVDADVIGSLVVALLDLGAVYYCCWGQGCERTHDIVDEVVQLKQIEEGTDSVIMTTWHDDEELSDALEFSLLSAEPDEYFSAGCNAMLSISVGSTYLAAQTELYLAKYMPKHAI